MVGKEVESAGCLSRDKIRASVSQAGRVPQQPKPAIYDAANVASAPDRNLSPILAYNQWLRVVQMDAERLINGLDMAAFRRRFQQHGSHIDLPQFIRIVRGIADRTERRDSVVTLKFLGGLDEEEVTSRLMELFREIDLDGDGKIVWEEFTRFILDKATQVGQQASGLHKAHDARQDAPYLPIRRGSIIPPHLARHKFPYERIACLPDRTVPLLATVEHESTVVQFHAIQHSSIPPVGCIKSKGKILAIADLPWPISSFATSDSDLCLRTWYLDDTRSTAHKWTLKQEWPVAKTQYSLCYNPTHRLLLSGGVADITAWHMPDHVIKLRFPQAHTGTIFSLLSLTDFDAVASASADATVCIWDLPKERLVQRLTAHKKGVLALGYCAPQRLLVSGGYDHEPHVWSPFVNMLLHKLVGHEAPVTAVQGVIDRPEIVTGDAHGIVKIWDLRTYRCIQSFQADGSELSHKRDQDGNTGDNEGEEDEAGEDDEGGDKRRGTGGGRKAGHSVAGSVIDALRLGQDSGPCDEVTGLVHMHVSPNLSRMIVATRRLNVLDQLYMEPDDTTDDMCITCACFNEVCLTVITAAGSTIRVWDGIYGSLKNTFYNVSKQGDISAMCLDDRGRKLLFGNNGGEVTVIAHQSGTFMKSFKTGADSGVVSIAYVGTGKQVLVAFADRCIRVYDEAPIAYCPLLRIIDWDNALSDLMDLSAISLFPHLFNGRGPYVAAACGPTVGLVNYSSGRCEALVTATRGEDEDEDDNPADATRPFVVLAVTFLGDSPLMALSCSDGHIQIWSVWPILGSRRGCIFRFSNEEPRGYTYDGEEDEPYPQLHPRGSGKKPTYPTNRPPVFNNKRQIVIPEIPKEPEKREWRARPRFDSPRRKMPLPAGELAWDPKDTSLYTGDESGRIRCWDLTSVYDCLEEHHLLVHTGSWRTRSLQPKKGKPVEEQLQFLTDDISAYLAWSLEAHDDAITCLSLTSEPRGIVSGSSDLFLKMWAISGRPYGRLIQSVPVGEKSPDWDLGLDVGKRLKKEDAVLGKVEMQMMMDTVRMSGTVRRAAFASTTRGGRAATADSDSAQSMKQMATEDADAHHRVLTRLAKLDVSHPRTKPPQVGPVPSLSEATADPSAAERRMKGVWFKAAVSKPWLEGLLEEDVAVKQHDEEGLPRLLEAIEAFEEKNRFKGAETQSLFSKSQPLRSSMRPKSRDMHGMPLESPRDLDGPPMTATGVLTLRRPPEVLASTRDEDRRLLLRNKPWKPDFVREVVITPSTTHRCRESFTLVTGTSASREATNSHESRYMEPWEFKQRKRRELLQERRKQQKASRSPHMATRADARTAPAKAAKDRRISCDDAVWMAVADSEEKKEHRRLNKEERERVRAAMLTGSITQQAWTSADMLAMSRCSSAPTVRRPLNSSSQTSQSLHTTRQEASQSRTVTPSLSRSMRTASPIRSVREGGDVTKTRTQRTPLTKEKDAGGGTRRHASSPATRRGNTQKTTVPGDTRQSGSHTAAPMETRQLVALAANLGLMDGSRSFKSPCDVEGWSTKEGDGV